MAPPGFCNRGGSEVWVYRGSRVRSPPVPVVLSVYQRGSLLDGLGMYLSRDTKKFHDNESTHILHNFRTSTHRGKLLSPWLRHCGHAGRQAGGGVVVVVGLLTPSNGERRSPASSKPGAWWLKTVSTYGPAFAGPAACVQPSRDCLLIDRETKKDAIVSHTGSATTKQTAHVCSIGSDRVL